MRNKIRTIPEPNKTIDLVRECDVVAVGGGVAVPAARNGADTAMQEICRVTRQGIGTGFLLRRRIRACLLRCARSGSSTHCRAGSVPSGSFRKQSFPCHYCFARLRSESRIAETFQIPH